MLSLKFAVFMYYQHFDVSTCCSPPYFCCWRWWRIDDDELFLWYGWLNKGLSILIFSRDHCQWVIFTTAYLRHAASRTWICAEPEFMLSGMTLYSSDNHYTTVVIVVFVEVEQGSANAYWVVYGRVIVLFPSHKHLFYEKPIFFAWVSIYWTYWLKLGWYFLNTLLKFYLFILFNCLFS